MIIIEVKNLKKYFGETKAVDGVSFEVKKGEIMGFLGPNGAGKTTTIRCMMDFLNPDEGNINILGLNAHDSSEKLKKDIGYLSGEVNLYENWTGKEHIDIVKSIRKIKTKEPALIKKLDFDVSKKFKNLSSGNKQKLGLILALMHKPKVLILDEPTLGLDPLLQDVIHETLRSEAKKGITIFMSSHNLSEVERVCDRACIIKKGKIIKTENISELMKKKLYTVNVYFKGKIPKKELISNGVNIEKELEEGVVLTVRGNIRPLLRKIDKFDIKDIGISHSRLEDVFLEFYKN